VSLLLHPQLMQCVVTTPNALWGVERLNLGYKGATVRVRRSSDNAEADCASQADIAAHCSGTNGFVKTTYDQTGNGRDLTQPTAASQPKCFDSATGILRFGRTPVMSFDGTDDQLSRADNCGVPSGSPALTTALVTGTYSNTGKCWSMGPNNQVSGVDGEAWYAARGTGIMAFSFRVRAYSFTAAPDANSAPTYHLFQKAANALASATFIRENKTALTRLTGTDGAHVLAIGFTHLGAGIFDSEWATETVALHGHWNALLTGADLDALEQVLERLRVQ
jgi:hypothetical protein